MLDFRPGRPLDHEPCRCRRSSARCGVANQTTFGAVLGEGVAFSPTPPLSRLPCSPARRGNASRCWHLDRCHLVVTAIVVLVFSRPLYREGKLSYRPNYSRGASRSTRPEYQSAVQFSSRTGSHASRKRTCLECRRTSSPKTFASRSRSSRIHRRHYDHRDPAVTRLPAHHDRRPEALRR